MLRSSPCCLTKYRYAPYSQSSLSRAFRAAFAVLQVRLTWPVCLSTTSYFTSACSVFMSFPFCWLNFRDSQVPTVTGHALTYCLSQDSFAVRPFDIPSSYCERINLPSIGRAIRTGIFSYRTWANVCQYSLLLWTYVHTLIPILAVSDTNLLSSSNLIALFILR